MATRQEIWGSSWASCNGAIWQRSTAGGGRRRWRWPWVVWEWGRKKTEEELAAEAAELADQRFDKVVEGLFAGDRISEDQLRVLQDSTNLQGDLLSQVQAG